MEQLLRTWNDALWGWPLLGLILGTGAWLTLRLGVPQRNLGRGLRLLLRRGGGAGVSPFGALCASLSATIGTGNVVGVATALALGGPGALVWMELSALTGLAIQYAEGFLAVRWRYHGPEGPRGGPFAYIALGLGPRYRVLAGAFALCGALAGLLGVGTFVQAGSMAAALELYRARHLPGLPLPGWALGTALAAGTALVLRGGRGRLFRLSARVVPVMGGLYVLCCGWILLSHPGQLGPALETMVRGAFSPGAAAGGLLGTLRAGVSRGIFSNEAGLGTAPIAAASATGVSPREQGWISMTGTVFDTFLLCTLTGLAILVSGAPLGELGLAATLEAFALGLPLPGWLSRGLVVGCLCLFAFTTVVGWSFYAVSCLDYLTGGRAWVRRAYLGLYVATVAAAPMVSPAAVWLAASLCNGLMAIPNLLGILRLTAAGALDGDGIIEENPTKEARP